ncbi:MAG: M3 family metallopeptidase [Pseudobdellovibrionaceae bacterium]
METQNPFFQKSNLKDEAIHFGLIKTEHFVPALKQAIADAKNTIQKIKSDSAPPDFANTIEALEVAPEKVEQIAGTYFNLLSAEGTEPMQALAGEISSSLAAFSSDINLDTELFAKIKTVHEKCNNSELSKEQIRLVEKYYKDFARNGALLSKADKERIRQIDQELSTLSPQFSENILKATNAFEMLLTDKKDLEGLPASTLEAAEQAAKEKGKTGWLFTLQIPSFFPFMKYSKNRELREKIWKAYSSKSFRDSFDNQELVKKIVTLRHKRAQLLGYKTHAEFVLADRMAQSTETVMNFLNRLLEPSKRAALGDIAELRALRKELEGQDEVMPWDMAYLSELLKEKKYKFNEEELRPYFKLENVIAGVFEHARRLYGLVFKEVSLPVYSSEVKTYEVVDESTGKYVGLFYADFFPRPAKRAGAWMTAYREQGLWGNEVKRPHVGIVCNFTKPTATKPSLLDLDEVLTLFHEFGHALHGLLSNCRYRSIAGTNVYWDFVELPSQIMENWVYEKESLDLFAKHYETGQPMPKELVDKIIQSSRFQAGLQSLRQLSFGFLDMAWHAQDPSAVKDVDQFEKSTLAPLVVMPLVPGSNSSVSFAHIFSGGYSAGYYSYKWAEVLDADAFEYFLEKGLFDPAVAKSFKENILSKGGSEHPMELYKKFRGREPDPDSVLRRDGLLK